MSGLWMRVSDAATRIGAQVGRSDGEFSGVTIDSAVLNLAICSLR